MRDDLLCKVTTTLRPSSAALAALALLTSACAVRF